MESKFQKKSLFESGFDSFELDDGFLMKLDSDLKQTKNNKKQHEAEKFNLKESLNQEKKDKNQYYDLPLFIEDLDESDFFECSNNRNKKHSSKVVSSHKKDKSRNVSNPNNFLSSLSPIQGPKSTTQMNLSSSTPVKPIPDSNPKEKPTTEDKSAKNFDYVYSEADLFDDWDMDEIKNTQKSTVTFSQALKLIDEAESANDQKETLNRSIDLLTGEIVCVDMGVMFDESFGIPEPTGNKDEDPNCSNDSIIILEETKPTCKPSAAQKLNFETNKENNLGSVFSSDDDFDFLTQDLLDKPKEGSKCTKRKLSKVDVTPLKNSDLNDSTDAVIPFRRRKCFKVIESDTAEDSPSPKFRRQIKKLKKRKNFQVNFGKEFIEAEAEISDEVEVSSDETEEDGEYDKSFLDEESYFTQNCSANMTSKYLESVKGVNVPGSFKIPAPKPYNPENVFSQIPEENDPDYEIDSFCVNEVEEEMKTELSDLEIAEKILEMDRKERKRKRFQKFRK